jgi:hypothetical protein
MVVNLKDFYPNTPLERYEYMRLPLAMIPDEIIQQYQLRKLATPNGWIYIEIRKGMYGLKQATPPNTPPHTRILPNPQNTWTLETHHPKRQLLSRC